MPKMRVNTGTSASPNWTILDAKDADTVDGLHMRVSNNVLQYSSNGSTYTNAGMTDSERNLLNTTTATANNALPKSGGVISGDLAVSNQLKVRYNGASNITMPIGDSDTGLHWAGDGVLEIWSNNIPVARTQDGILKLRGSDGVYRGVNEMNKVAVASDNVRYSDATARSFYKNSPYQGMLFYRFIAPASGEYRINGTVNTKNTLIGAPLYIAITADTGYNYQHDRNANFVSASRYTYLDYTIPVGTVIDPKNSYTFYEYKNTTVVYDSEQSGNRDFSFTVRVSEPGPVYLIVSTDGPWSTGQPITVSNVAVRYDLINV
ncbi:hypothetical protein [Paenibacillus medicaginis]|uniref:Uncharacterized protein n=1 Tax=Paenibacillus medicaginis TaxID=1470560 RepID=A0ABV5BVD7_9BACL